MVSIKPNSGLLDQLGFSNLSLKSSNSFMFFICFKIVYSGKYVDNASWARFIQSKIHFFKLWIAQIPLVFRKILCQNWIIPTGWFRHISHCVFMKTNMHINTLISKFLCFTWNNFVIDYQQLIKLFINFYIIVFQYVTYRPY